MRPPRVCLALLLLLGACGDEAPPPDECGADADCPAAAPLCREGACVGCATDTDCSSGRCDAGACVACLTDSDCGPRFACRGASCELAEDCVVGVVDDGCGSCTADADCFAGETCREGACVAPCEETDDPERYCLATSLAGRRAPGCQLDFLDVGLPFCDGPGPLSLAPDCDPCLVSLGGCGTGGCDDGYCLCATSADCPPGRGCVDGRCDAELCRDDEECPCDTYCDGERCRPVCRTDEDCPIGRCEPEGGRCVPCLSDGDCEGPERCYADGCVVPCQSDAVCDASCTDTGRCTGCSAFEPGPRPSTPRRCP